MPKLHWEEYFLIGCNVDGAKDVIEIEHNKTKTQEQPRWIQVPFMLLLSY
jgi:hypothetical protein